MTQTVALHMDRIGSLLAEKGYEVTEVATNVLKIREVTAGVPIHAVLDGNILFLSLNCVAVPAASVTADLMRKMLAADNGISTSHFQLYDTGDGTVAVTLNNFCTLQDMGPDDEDDILNCVNFLLVDVVEAKQLLASLLK